MKVLISGAGISGTALAFWLAKLEYMDVTVVERFPSLRTSGLQLDLRGHGIAVLRLMGLDAAFRARAAPEQGMAIVNGRGARLAYLGSNTSGKGRQNFTSEYEIMRGALCRLFHDASLEAAAAAAAGGRNGGGGVKYVFDNSIQELGVTETGVNVRFANGDEETFDLVVGADGQWSRTRRMMLGHNTTTTTASSFPSPTPSSSSSSSPDPSLHLIPGMYAGYFTAPRALHPPFDTYDSTLYLAPRGRSIMTRRSDPSSIQVYMMCTAEAPGIRAARRGDTGAERAAFAAHYAGAGWRSDELVAAMRDAGDFYCERVGLVRMPPGGWRHRAGRVVLLGDAAYCPSVLTGMGTTSSVVGAYVLAGELSRIGGGGGHAGLGDALEAYEDRFRPFMEQVQEGVGEDSLMARVLMPSSWLGIGLLNVFLRVVTFLGISLPSSAFLKEHVKWDLPQYDRLVRK